MANGKVIIRLSGGVGNQMFQWALGKMIEETTDMEVYFDKIDAKPYQLNIFKTEPKFIEDSSTRLKLDIIWALRGILNWQSFLGFTLYSEKQFNFDRGINKIRRNSYINGFFQSELYFKSVEQKVRENLQFDAPLEGQNQSFASQLYSLNSIGVHILSDNYTRLGKYKKKYAKCSPEYYQNAVEHIAKINPNPTVIVFSDDINWAKQNIKFKYKTIFVSHNKGKKSYEDLRLMSLCTHNVISNSSFAWWGAWLNNNSQKIVVAPEKWFNDDKIIQSDVIPSSWIKLENFQMQHS